MINTKDSNLDKNSPIPLYLQLRHLLILQIANGDFDDGGLPSELDVEEKYGVSRTTVRLAMNALVTEGYITRHRGVGSFVIRPKTRILGNAIRSVSDDLQSMGQKAKTQVIRFQVAAAPSHVANLFSEKDSKGDFFIVELVRTSDSEPIVMATIFVPHKLRYKLSPTDFEEYGSTITLLEARFGMKIIGASRSLEAATCNQQEASLLNLEPNDPVLITRTIVYGELGEPLYFAKSRYRSDRCEYYIPFLPRDPIQSTMLQRSTNEPAKALIVL